MRFLAELAGRIARLDGVRQVFSLANAQQIVTGDAGAEMAPVVPSLDAPDFAERLRAVLDRNPDFTGLFVSADRATTGILIEIEDRPGDSHYRGALIDALRAAMDEMGSAPGVSLYLTGIAVQKHDVSDYIERDRVLLMPIAVAVLGLVLAVFFRSLVGVALPLAVTGVTVAWTLGVYQLAGLEINAITALLPPVLMVLSLAVSVHLIQGWLDAPRSADRIARLRAIVRRLVFPCFFCTLTTTLGFGSLVMSDMPAVRYFGLFAALGVVVAFAAGMTLVPIGLSFLDPPASPLATPQHRGMQRVLGWASRVSVERPWRVLAIFFAITALAMAGAAAGAQQHRSGALPAQRRAAAPRHALHRLASHRHEHARVRRDAQRRRAARLARRGRAHGGLRAGRAAPSRGDERRQHPGRAPAAPARRVRRRRAGTAPRRARHRLRLRPAPGGAGAGADPQADRAGLPRGALQRAHPRRRHVGRGAARGVDPRRRAARCSATATASRSRARSTRWRRTPTTSSPRS